MENTKPVYTSLEHGCRLMKEIDETSTETIEDLQFLWQTALGSLVFAMVSTKPEITYFMGALARYTNVPTA